MNSETYEVALSSGLGAAPIIFITIVLTLSLLSILALKILRIADLIHRKKPWESRQKQHRSLAMYLFAASAVLIIAEVFIGYLLVS
jgi:hypothetical protein